MFKEQKYIEILELKKHTLVIFSDGRLTQPTPLDTLKICLQRRVVPGEDESLTSLPMSH